MKGWKHEVHPGAGALWYQASKDVGYYCHYFRTEEEVTKAETWLLEALDAGTVDANTAYLTRWSANGNTVQLVIGQFYEWPKTENEVGAATSIPPKRTVWINARKRRNYASSFANPQRFVDLLDEKIRNNDLTWLKSYRGFVAFTKPEDGDEWVEQEY